MSDEEKATLYLCGICEYSALHTFTGGAKGQAFKLQEMGAAGTSSLEHGDASGIAGRHVAGRCGARSEV